MLYSIDLLLLLFVGGGLGIVLWDRRSAASLARTTYVLLMLFLLSQFAHSCGLLG